jgi:four helix bundle protein
VAILPRQAPGELWSVGRVGRQSGFRLQVPGFGGKEKMAKGHNQLEIYKTAHAPAVKVHELSMLLPSFERFEEGSQVRRSAKSVSSDIVEGYALRKYKNEFLHYLFRAYGSAEETAEHLKFLFETKAVKDEDAFRELLSEYDKLCGKIMRYIQAVDREYETPNFMKEPIADYLSNLESET